jgi:hypothetical protein
LVHRSNYPLAIASHEILDLLETDFEFSMVPGVKEREHDPQRNFGLDTGRLQRAVDREAERSASRYCSDALKGIGPVGHRHINFRGTFRFPVERYADQLVPSAS